VKHLKVWSANVKIIIELKCLIMRSSSGDSRSILVPPW